MDKFTLDILANSLVLAGHSYHFFFYTYPHRIKIEHLKLPLQLGKFLKISKLKFELKGYETIVHRNKDKFVFVHSGFSNKKISKIQAFGRHLLK